MPGRMNLLVSQSLGPGPVEETIGSGMTSTSFVSILRPAPQLPSQRFQTGAAGVRGLPEMIIDDAGGAPSATRCTATAGCAARPGRSGTCRPRPDRVRRAGRGGEQVIGGEQVELGAGEGQQHFGGVVRGCEVHSVELIEDSSSQRASVTSSPTVVFECVGAADGIAGTGAPPTPLGDVGSRGARLYGHHWMLTPSSGYRFGLKLAAMRRPASSANGRSWPTLTVAACSR